MRVEIWSDLVCPWCYIGRARFAAALDLFEHRHGVEVVNRSYELDPTATSVEVPLLAYLAERFGSTADGAAAMEQRVVDQARAEGLGYTVDRRHGNTLRAHQLVHLARSLGVEDAVFDRLLSANFAEGRSIIDPRSLTELGVEAGLPADEIAATFARGRFVPDIRGDEHRAVELGVRGVPFFVMDERLGVSGAQSTATFLGALEQAWALGSTGSD